MVLARSCKADDAGQEIRAHRVSAPAGDPAVQTQVADSRVTGNLDSASAPSVTG